MEWEDIYSATLSAMEEHARKQAEDAPQLSPGMMAIEPFEAECSDGGRCRAIGVVTNPAQDALDFVVIKEYGEGELVPTTEGSLWRVAQTTSQNEKPSNFGGFRKEG